MKRNPRPIFSSPFVLAPKTVKALFTPFLNYLDAGRLLMFPASIILSLALMVSAVSAGTADREGDETIDVGEIVVTATRYEEQISGIPANVTVITEDEIKNSTARDIPDLLRTEVGIQVTDITGNGRNLNVDVRGFGETAPLNTLVLVDGRRVNQADLSGADWIQIPLDRVKRIEIIRGGRGSVLYGDNAAGGVINIITRSGNKFRTGGELAYGSYDTFRGNGFVGGTAGDLSYYLSGSYSSTDGYRENSNSESKDFGTKLDYYIGDSLRLGLSSGYHKDNTGLPGALRESDLDSGVSRRDSLNPKDFADTEDYYVTFTPQVYFLDESYFKVETSYRKRSFLSFASFADGNFTGDTEIDTIAISPQLLLKGKIGGIPNTLTAGFDYQKAKEDILNDSLFFGTRTLGNFRLEKENYGYYIHDRATVTDGLEVSGGYRFDSADFSFSPSTPDSTTLDQNLFTLGINYRYQKDSHVYASYSRSFRYPVLDELFSFFTNTLDTGLVQQTSNDYEIGLRHRFNDAVSASINVFRIDTDDEIFFNPMTYANENLDGTTRRQGLEVSFETKALDWLSLGGSYTYTDATIRGGQFEGNDIPGVPRHKATLNTLLTFKGGISMRLSGVYTGERAFISDFNNEFDRQKGHIIFNAKVMYRWKKMTAFVDVLNITNKEYSEYGVISGFPAEKAFYPSPKRNFLVGVRVEL
ncbi:ferrienterobactin receptor precursor [bacterium BMS3Bbin06]|nr:ferrienterobactin receptor precursor [bacterium BMS3Bbin06]HDO35442.1 TonB-dependent receptor [Nitrospirota bacterium]